MYLLGHVGSLALELALQVRNLLRQLLVVNVNLLLCKITRKSAMKLKKILKT